MSCNHQKCISCVICTPAVCSILRVHLWPEHRLKELPVTPSLKPQTVMMISRPDISHLFQMLLKVCLHQYC